MMKVSCVLFVVFCSVALSLGESRKSSGAAAVAPGPAISLEHLNSSLQSVTKQVQPAVVQVLNSALVMESDGDRGGATFANLERSSGSGILISADGYIVTNAHVVQDSHRLRVRLNHAVKIAGNHLLDAQLIGLDRDTDLAVIKVDLTGLPFLSFADSSALAQGQVVLAFGSPLGLDNSVSMGVVSAVDRQLDEDSPLVFIQTDAAINPGNSGGPLVDIKGQVVGINTFILSKSGGNEGLGFAIPSNLASSICRQIRTEHHVHHHEIGVFVRGITPELVQGLGLSTAEGLLVEDIAAQSPAEAAGLNVGDIIIAVGDRPIPNVRQLALNMYLYKVGDRVPITVLRGTERLVFAVPLVERADDPQKFEDLASAANNSIPKLGILGLTVDESIEPLLPPLRLTGGVLVAAKLRNGNVFLGDELLPGDVIHALNGKEIKDISHLNDLLDSSSAELVFQVERLGRLKYLVLEKP